MNNKLIVKTKGSFGLVDPGYKQKVDPNRPYVVCPTNFINAQLGSGKLLLLALVGLEGTDQELADIWYDSKCSEEKTIEIFTKKFPLALAKEPEAGEGNEPNKEPGRPNPNKRPQNTK